MRAGEMSNVQERAAAHARDDSIRTNSHAFSVLRDRRRESSRYFTAMRMPLMCLWHWKHVSVNAM